MGLYYAYFSPSMDVSSIPIKIDLHNFNWYLAIRMCKLSQFTFAGCLYFLIVILSSAFDGPKAFILCGTLKMYASFFVLLGYLIALPLP